MNVLVYSTTLVFLAPAERRYVRNLSARTQCRVLSGHTVGSDAVSMLLIPGRSSLPQDRRLSPKRMQIILAWCPVFFALLLLPGLGEEYGR